MRRVDIGGGPVRPSLSVMLEELAAQAWELDVPETRRGLDRDACALLVDGLLSRVARGRGALDVAIGERLCGLSAGDRAMRLGYSGIVDYAREVLGIAGRTAVGMVRLARELRARPLLSGAVRRGEVSTRKAEVILGVATGEDEAAWVERARALTVRELQQGARAGRDRDDGGSRDRGSDDEPWWDRFAVEATPATRERFEQAMEMAGEVLGPTSHRWERLEAICQEYLGAHEGPGQPEPERVRDDAAMPGLRAALEEETRRWEALEVAPPVEVPGGDAAGDGGGDGAGGGPGGDAAGDAGDPRRIDAALRDLARMRAGWDELVGHLAFLVRHLSLWRELGFASFDHYCAERLGLAGRTVEQRAWLERKLHDLPVLREAMREGRVSYEKARIVAGVASEDSAARWIERAERLTCIALRREAEAHEVRQTCAEGRISVRVPAGVAFLAEEAFAAARKAAGRWLTPDECLFALADHFVRTWEGLVERRTTPERRAIERDRGFCQVPGCSRAAVHAHHVVFRSHGGGDDPANLVGLCAAHHLHGVHAGWVRVRGSAPDGLVWELGEVRDEARDEARKEELAA